MEVKKCRHCDRLFQYHGSKYCPSCVIELDKIFILVREYIYDNPEATVTEVSDNTEVDSEIIMEFLREGKLELKEASLLLECRSCGKAIRSGMMCTECFSKFETGMKKGLTTAAGIQKSLKDSKKMHSAEYIKKRNE